MPHICLKIATPDIQIGDLIDLECDPYADPENDNPSLKYEYVEVVEVTRENSICVAIGFEGFDTVGFPVEHQLSVKREIMTPYDAWLFAATWGSYMTGGDPGACMYGFDERFVMQSEEHRAQCLKWIDKNCIPQVEANPSEYADDELEQLRIFRNTGSCCKGG